MTDGFQATRETIAALEKLNIPYMLVGGLSSMAYGIPRSTKDADIVLAIAKRGKDRDDVRDILAVQGDEALDWDYIHHWTAEHKTRELLEEIRASIPPIE